MATLDPARLRSRLLALPAQRLRMVGYRSVIPRYAIAEEILSGQGSNRCGARWNPPGIAAIYASLTPETAMAETLAHFRYYNIPTQTALPRVFVAIEFKLSRMIDLTDGTNRSRLQISQRRMIKCDWRREQPTGLFALTQMIGAAAHATGWEALLVPSAVETGGANVVIFPDNMKNSSSLRVLNADQLTSQ